VRFAATRWQISKTTRVAEWSRGFLRGHQWLEESWESYVPAELDDDFAALLMTLSFFASKELAEAFCAETKLDLAEMAAKLHGVFADAITEYAHLGRSIPYRRSSPRRLP
jgi:hypothetical protein